MKRFSISRIAGLAAIAAGPLLLAACDAATSPEGLIEPTIAQQLVAERADPDKALADKVKKALGTSEGAAYGVEVSATEGTVILWGEVDSTSERKRIATTAAGVVGVHALVNNLTVDPGA
jgi:osmotically-inducible protein OsmY